MRRLPSKLSITIVSAAALADAPESYSPLVRQPATPQSAKDSLGGRSLQSTPVFPPFSPLDNLPRFISRIKCHPSKLHNLSVVFSKLGQAKPSPNLSTSIARQSANLCKNRYVDVLPYNHSRVVLDPKVGSSDYINASLVTLSEFGQTYIMAQGPLDETVDAFWHMVWQQRACVIVALVQVYEAGRKKCAAYWPAVRQQITMEGGLAVKCLQQRVLQQPAGTIERMFELSLKGKGSYRVVQLHFGRWPDYGVPADASEVADLVQACATERQRSRYPESPMVVHCSAGIGRSGCFVAVDAVVELLKRSPAQWRGDSDLVRSAVLAARKYRKGVVQTAMQFGFCYDVVERWAYGYASPGWSGGMPKDMGGEERERPASLLYRFPRLAWL